MLLDAISNIFTHLFTKSPSALEWFFSHLTIYINYPLICLHA